METKENNKELFPVTVSVWNDKIDKTISEIGDYCMGYKWMHIVLAKKYMTRYNILMLSTISMGPMIGLMGTLSTVVDSVTFKILITILGFVSGVTAAVIKYGKFQQKSTSHKTTAARYASLEGNIKRQMSLSRSDRVNAGKYLQWISTSFDDLWAASPLINSSVYQHWVNIAKRNKLSIPKEYSMIVETDNNDKETFEQMEKDIETNKEVRVDIPVIHKDKGKDSFKRERTTTYAEFPELNQFADGKMKYEMDRMAGFGN